MIQNIYPHTFSNEYKDVTVNEDDYIVSYYENKAFIDSSNDTILLPKYNEVKDQLTQEQCQFLFEIDGEKYFLARKQIVEFSKYTYVETKVYRFMEPMYRAFACGVGEHLYRWYQNNRFCGSCGGKLVASKKERALCCEHCGRIIYPKISPSVIVAIYDGDRLLMTKYARGIYRKYALVAGYTEIGETIEETVHREVMEETGLKVKNLRYYKSQPWPFSDALLYGFFAELDGSDQITLQEEELAEAVWFERSEIPVNPAKISLTNEMIERFRAGKEKE